MSEWITDYIMLLLPFAIRKATGRGTDAVQNAAEKRQHTVLKAAYVVIVAVCCVSGIELGFWMRNKIDRRCSVVGDGARAGRTGNRSHSREYGIMLRTLS